MSAEFRVYNKLDCSFFDLLGKNEPDQTKGLGYLLAKSPTAMEKFLQLFFNKSKVKQLLNSDYIVNCEPISTTSSQRADIIIRFFNNYQPDIAIVVEAKAAGKTISNVGASAQVLSYLTAFNNLLSRFNPKNVIPITLTTITEITTTNIQTITWQTIITTLSNQNEQIINQYINYIKNISVMKFYDEEIMSLPAGKTYSSIEATGIYECPTTGAYKSRGQRFPLYIAFRQSRKRGINKLFKIADVLILDINDPDAISALDPSVQQRINKYKSLNSGVTPGQKYLFILDQKPIELAYPVLFKSNRGMTGVKYISLQDVFDKKNIKGNNVVI